MQEVAVPSLLACYCRSKQALAPLCGCSVVFFSLCLFHVIRSDLVRLLSFSLEHCHCGHSWKNVLRWYMYSGFTDRTDVQCLHWWQKVLNPNLVKGVWTKSEDDRILELVIKHGASTSAGVLQYGQLNQESLAQHYEEESGTDHSHRSSIKSFGCIPSTSGFNEPHKFSGSIGILSEYGGEGWSVNK